MLHKIIYSLFFILFAKFSPAQIQSYSFYVVDKDSKEAIAFLSVYNPKTKTAFQSNESGLIVIQDSNKKSTYSSYHLSYESVVIDLNKLEDSILLDQKAYELYTVNLIELSAEELIKKAIKNIEENYQTSTNYISGDYFQIHRENQKFVRYIEAKTAVQKMGYSPKTKLAQEEKFAIKHLRKSYNYEKNGEQHGDHLVDLFLENPIQYLEKGILNPNNLAMYNWQYSSKTKDVYKIVFQNKVWGSQRNLSGEIEINVEDFAILSIMIIEMPNAYAKDVRESSWQFVNGWYEISFRKNGDKYDEEKSKQWYHHLVKDENNSSSFKYEVEEQFIWETDFDQEEKTTLDYAKMSNLYSLNMPYDSLLWQDNYHLEEVKSDLELTYSLNYQFNNP